MSIPGLPRGRRRRVFRRICQQLMTDPVLSSVVKTWDTWDGQPDHAPAVVSNAPMVRLTPRLGPVDWYSPDAQAGPLEITIEANVDTFDACDCLDLWEAIELAIYPADRTKRDAFEQELRGCPDLCCETGQVTFSRPASIQSAENGQFLLVGMMSVDIVRPFNP